MTAPRAQLDLFAPDDPEPAAAAPLTLADWLVALLSAPASEQRVIAFRGTHAGLAMQHVVCTLHRESFTWVGAYRHLAETESLWREEHREDGENAALHRITDMRPATMADTRPASFWSTSPCRSCKAQLIWARTSAGKRMPVDAAADPNGTIVLASQPSTDDPPLAVVVHTEAERAAIPADQLHTSHFATCPKADQWRRSR